MRSVSAEVEACIPFFTRLCVNSVVITGVTLDEAAHQIAREFYGRIPRSMPAELVAHFTKVLEDLVELVSALAVRLPPQLIRDYSERTSPSQVANTLKGSMLKALNDIKVSSEARPEVNSPR